MMRLIEHCLDHTVEEVLELPDLKERVDVYMAHRHKFEEQVRRCTTVHGKLAVLDYREEDMIYAGNRFMIYALLPKCNVSVHVIWGVQKRNTVFAIGKSILDRSSPADVGAICLGYGGGGHRGAGTCQVSNDDSGLVKAELVAALSQVPALQHA